MHESPRYEIVVKKNYREGVFIMENMARANGVGLELSREDDDRLQGWVESNESFKNMEEVASVGALFKGNTANITMYLWPVWMLLSLIYYGMVYILPMTLEALNASDGSSESSSEDIWGVVLAVSSEIPSIVVGYLIVERDMFGRKNSMIIGFLACGASLLIATLFSGFVFWVSVSRGFINCVFIIVSPYTTELYPTNIRTTGLGMASAASRIGGIIMPWITLGLFGIGPTLPFVGFVAFSAVGAYCCYKLPYDTTNKALDEEPEGQNVEMNEVYAH
jgi:putative MFS transporter